MLSVYISCAPVCSVFSRSRSKRQRKKKLKEKDETPNICARPLIMCTPNVHNTLVDDGLSVISTHAVHLGMFPFIFILFSYFFPASPFYCNLFVMAFLCPTSRDHQKVRETMDALEKQDIFFIVFSRIWLRRCVFGYIRRNSFLVLAARKVRWSM